MTYSSSKSAKSDFQSEISVSIIIRSKNNSLEAHFLRTSIFEILQKLEASPIFDEMSVIELKKYCDFPLIMIFF